jgi:hypothetical protein
MSLTSPLENFIKCNPTLLYARIELQLSAIRTRVEAFIDIVQQLQHHKLSIKLLDFQQWQQLHNSVKSAKVKRKDLDGLIYRTFPRDEGE